MRHAQLGTANARRARPASVSDGQEFSIPESEGDLSLGRRPISHRACCKQNRHEIGSNRRSRTECTGRDAWATLVDASSGRRRRDSAGSHLRGLLARHMANVALEIDGGHGLAERDDHDDAIYRLPLSRPWLANHDSCAGDTLAAWPELRCLVGSAWGSPHLHALLRADHDVHRARLPMETKLRLAVQRHHNARAESKKEKSACCACDLAPAYALSASLHMNGRGPGDT